MNKAMTESVYADAEGYTNAANVWASVPGGMRVVAKIVRSEGVLRDVNSAYP
jgi:hypothetical protein